MLCGSKKQNAGENDYQKQLSQILPWTSPLDAEFNVRSGCFLVSRAHNTHIAFTRDIGTHAFSLSMADCELVAVRF